MGVWLLGVTVGLAVLATWRAPSPRSPQPWVWLGVVAGLTALFRVSPTHFVGDRDLGISNVQQLYLHLGPVRVLEGVSSPGAEFAGTNTLVLDLYSVWLVSALVALWLRRPESAFGVAFFTPPFAFLNLHRNQRPFESAPTAVTLAGRGLAAASFVVLGATGLRIRRGNWARGRNWLAASLRRIRSWGY